jgi:hypothetical protein
MQYPAYIGLTTDTPNNDTPPSPYSIRYYTQHHIPMSANTTIQIRLQVDGGANRSLTNKKEYLSRYQPTQTYNIYGVTKDEIALQCTGKGYLPWPSDNGDILYIPCYYSPNAAETIISPTDVVMSHRHLYTGWAQFAHINTGRGHVTFYRLEGTNHTNYSLTMANGLWYHQAPQLQSNPPSHHETSPSLPTEHAIVHRLTNQARYELFHQCCCHSGKRKMDILHKHIQGLQPLKGNAFHLCQSDPNIPPLDWLDLVSPVEDAATLQAGEMYHMDFGFPRGQNYSIKDEYGRLQTSIDGYRAYLLIIDRKTRYIWVIVTKNKLPPCEAVTKFLSVHGRAAGRGIVRTDKSRELWGSLQFKDVIHKAGYIIEPTAPGAPFQTKCDVCCMQPIWGQSFGPMLLYMPSGCITCFPIVLPIRHRTIA